MSRDKYYEPKDLFQCGCYQCIEVEVKPGQLGSLRVFDAPETFCFHVEHVHFGKCCKTKHYTSVKDPECKCFPVCPLELDAGCEYCDVLKTGHYKISVFDMEGNPVTPDAGEVIFQFSQRGC